MATDDRQVLVTGTAPAPAIFTVPGNGQIQPKAVFAHYDGTAAASAFVPALKVFSDGGELVAVCPAPSSIAAAGSADVSWFPHVACCPTSSTANDYTNAVQALGPWAYWPLNEPAGSSTVLDNSGHGRTLNVDTGFVTLGNPGLLATSPMTCSFSTWQAATNRYNFSSVGSQTFSASVVTLEFWLSSGGHAPNTMGLGALGRLDTERTWLVTVDSSGHPAFSWIDGAAVTHTISFGVGVVDSATHQLVLVMDGTNVKCYVDGVFFQSQVAGGTLNTPATHTAYLGQPAGGAGSRYYTGFLGPCVVYDKVLTAAEIAVLYNSGQAVLSNAAVASVTAGDTSIVIGGTATDPTVEAASLDVIAADHPTAADWSNSSHKITGLTEGAAAGEAATYAATDAGIVTAKGDIVAATGSHAVTNVAVGANATVLTADSTQAAGVKWAAAGSSPLTTKGDIFGHSTVDAAIPVGTNGQVLIADSTQALGVRWGAGSSSGSNVNIQSFAAGAGQSWSKPVGVSTVQVICIGAGGGGGSGGWATATGNANSGGGGGGGCVTQAIFRAADLGGSESVTVGTGGTGGVSIGGSQSPQLGGNGGATTFGTTQRLFAGGGGGGGSAGVTWSGGGGGGGATSAAANVGGTPGPAAVGTTGLSTQGVSGRTTDGASGSSEYGGAPGGNGGAGATSAAKAGGSSLFGGPGGGGGQSNTGLGGDGGANQSLTPGGGGTAGTTGSPPTPGNNGATTRAPYCGAGGGGGGAAGKNSGLAGGNGGNGGSGAGGGGGGYGNLSAGGGTGGNGGDGLCVVFSW